MNGKTPPFQILLDAFTGLIKSQEINQWVKISTSKNGVTPGQKLQDVMFLNQSLSTTLTLVSNHLLSSKLVISEAKIELER